MAKKRFWTEDRVTELKRLLFEEKYTHAEAAQELGSTKVAVQGFCKREDLRAGKGRKWRPEKVEELRRLIEDEELPQKVVAKKMKLSVSSIERACARYGLKTQRTGPRSGPLHPDWRGGKFVDAEGYVNVWVPPGTPGRKVSGYRLEHRMVMEQMLGRRLAPREVVHHVNGVKADNRPENLELFQSNGEHLAHELGGKTPNWTDEGCGRIAASIERNRKTRPGVESGVDHRSRTTARLKEIRGKETP